MFENYMPKNHWVSAISYSLIETERTSTNYSNYGNSIDGKHSSLNITQIIIITEKNFTKNDK